MGTSESKEENTGSRKNSTADCIQDSLEPVKLNIYTNNQPFSNTPGFGIYHSGVEVFGSEYTFGGGDTTASGIFSHRPQQPPGESGWIFKEQVLIGKTKYNKTQVQSIIFEIKKRYPANSYNILTRNCNHFADELCKELCGNPIPPWINRAAKVGNALKDFTGIDEKTLTQEQIKITPEIQVQESIDLYNFIDMKNIECLNEQKGTHPISNVFLQLRKKSFLGKVEENYLESDVDEQLLIHIPFIQNVKLKSLTIIGKEKDTAPKKVRLFLQKPTLNFDDVETTTSVQDLDLTEQQVLKGEPIQLKHSKFQTLSHLTIFVKSNQGNKPSTQISQLIFSGNPLQTTNLKDIKDNSSN